MIFDAEALLGIMEALAAAEGVPIPVSITTVRATVAQAKRLAGGRAEDEAAALFYACACQARLFGKIADRFLDGVGGAQARRVGLELKANELDIVLLRGRIAFGAADWNEVRETFAGWLHPLGIPTGRPAPKRPR